MIAAIYNEMLADFGDTFERTSLNSASSSSMTNSQTRVVNFDRFKDSVVKQYTTQAPASCDALLYTESELFLIEFKDGDLTNVKKHEIWEKILHSLLLMTEKLNQTIAFTRENVSFVLVYNESRRFIDEHLSKKAKTKPHMPFQLSRLKNLYFKDVLAYDIDEFEREFILQCRNY